MTKKLKTSALESFLRTLVENQHDEQYNDIFKKVIYSMHFFLGQVPRTPPEVTQRHFKNF